MHLRVGQLLKNIKRQNIFQGWRLNSTVLKNNVLRKGRGWNKLRKGNTLGQWQQTYGTCGGEGTQSPPIAQPHTPNSVVWMPARHSPCWQCGPTQHLVPSRTHWCPACCRALGTCNGLRVLRACALGTSSVSQHLVPKKLAITALGGEWWGHCTRRQMVGQGTHYRGDWWGNN